MSKTIRSFAASDEPSAWLSMPTPEEVFADPEAIPDDLLLPLLRVDGAEVQARLAGIPLVVVAHEVGIDELEFRVDEAGRYVLERYADVEIQDPADTREQLDDYIEREHDGPEGLADENEELFEEDEEERSFLRESDDDGSVQVHVGAARWLQHRTEPAPGEDHEFAFALMQHPRLFGAYYLFVDVEARRVRQVFQCT